MFIGDFEKAASWGIDHIRLPVDWQVFQREDGTFIESGFAYVDNAILWAKKYKLNLILDLHKTLGYSFDAGEDKNNFFANEKLHAHFYALWEEFSKRYVKYEDMLAFELLNEVTEKEYLPAWKRVSRACVRRIRALAPEMYVLLGSYCWNSARTLPELDPPYDDHVIYNFHFYEPHTFTHQGAYWMDESFDKARRVSYAESGVSEAWIEDFLAPAFEKAAQEGCELYCGEYGVIDVVPPEEALGWFRDLHAVFERHGVARSLWSYKQMDFGLSDARLDGVRDELLELL